MSDKKIIDEKPVEELIWDFVKGLYSLHGVDTDPTDEVIRIDDCKIVVGGLKKIDND